MSILKLALPSYDDGALSSASGRLLLGPTHILEPEVPIANIEAYIQAARE